MHYNAGRDNLLLWLDAVTLRKIHALRLVGYLRHFEILNGLNNLVGKKTGATSVNYKRDIIKWRETEQMVKLL